jgi:hypothetical protein
MLRFTSTQFGVVLLLAAEQSYAKAQSNLGDMMADTFGRMGS